MSGIFGDLIGGVLKGLAGQQGQAGGGGLGGILGQVLGNTDLGSLGGLLDQLQKSGLGPQVSSWLGNGANLPDLGRPAPSGAGRRHHPPDFADVARHPGRPAAQPALAASAGDGRQAEPERDAGAAARSLTGPRVASRGIPELACPAP